MVAQAALTIIYDKCVFITVGAHPYVSVRTPRKVRPTPLQKFGARSNNLRNLLMRILVNKGVRIETEMLPIKEDHKAENFSEFRFDVLVLMVELKMRKLIPQLRRLLNLVRFGV